jgi:hypothetical protein
METNMMTMQHLIDLMSSPQRTPEVVEQLTELITAPLRARLDLPALASSNATTACPCQFLIQQPFALPTALRPPVRHMLERAFEATARPSDENRAQYLGLTVTHSCGDRTEVPAIRWGFAFEPGATYKFKSGPDALFESIRKDLDLDLVRWSKVPNLPSFGIAFVGRRFLATEAQTRFKTVEALLDLAASDLRSLASRIAV